MSGVCTLGATESYYQREVSKWDSDGVVSEKGGQALNHRDEKRVGATKKFCQYPQHLGSVWRRTQLWEAATKMTRNTTQFFVGSDLESSWNLEKSCGGVASYEVTYTKRKDDSILSASGCCSYYHTVQCRTFRTRQGPISLLPWAAAQPGGLKVSIANRRR